MRIKIRNREFFNFCKRLVPHITDNAEGDFVIEYIHHPLRKCHNTDYNANFNKNRNNLVKPNKSLINYKVDYITDTNRNVK